VGKVLAQILQSIPVLSIKITLWLPASFNLL
jgi:hypothetical protein